MLTDNFINKFSSRNIFPKNLLQTFLLNISWILTFLDIWFLEYLIFFNIATCNLRGTAAFAFASQLRSCQSHWLLIFIISKLIMMMIISMIIMIIKITSNSSSVLCWEADSPTVSSPTFLPVMALHGIVWNCIVFRGIVWYCILILWSWVALKLQILWYSNDPKWLAWHWCWHDWKSKKK